MNAINLAMELLEKPVPTQIEENLKWRKLVESLSKADNTFRTKFILRCKEDIVFFIHSCLWTKNPRGMWIPGLNRKVTDGIPFILFEKQRKFAEAVGHAVRDVDGTHQIILGKSREQGATWIMGAACVWMFLFYPGTMSTISTLKLDALESRATSFFMQMDYMLVNCISNRFPFLVPFIKNGKRKEWRKQKFMNNPMINSQMTGAAASEDFARSDRVTMAIIDEAVAIESARRDLLELMISSAASACRIVVVMSTYPLEEGGHFLRLCDDKDWDFHKLHWTENPFQNHGMYNCERGKCRVHKNGGMPHSEWYDEGCKMRSFDVRTVGAELDMMPGNIGANVFSGEALKKVMRRLEEVGDRSRFVELYWKEPPDYRRDNEYISLAVKHEEKEFSRTKIWKFPDPEHRYVLGADISSGTGSDNAVAYVVDVDAEDGWDVVAEWSDSQATAIEAADNIAMLARFYDQDNYEGYQTLCGVERNAHGAACCRALTNFGVWLVRSFAKGKRGKVMEREGVFVVRENKVAMISGILQPLVNTPGDDGYPLLTCESYEFWNECRTFVVVKKDTCSTMKAAGKAKDDRVMAMLHACATAAREYGLHSSYNFALNQDEDEEEEVA
jgi:hypothetical protein